MPKIAEAWVDLGMKGMGNVNRDLERVRAGTEKIGKKFDDVRVVGERTWNRLGGGVRRFTGDMKRMASQTDEGKASVDGYEVSMSRLYDSLLGIVGLDLPSVFDLMASGVNALNKNTLESEHLLLSWLKGWLDLKIIIADLTDDNAMLNKARAEEMKLTQRLSDLQNEMTKRDVNAAQKRGDAGNKEGKAKQAAAGWGAPANQQQPAQLDEPKNWAERMKQRREQYEAEQARSRQQFLGKQAGQRSSHDALGGPPPGVNLREWNEQQLSHKNLRENLSKVNLREQNNSRPNKFSEMTPEQMKRYVEGAKHEEIDRLKQSSDPKERERGYQYEKYEKIFEEQDRIFHHLPPKPTPIDHEGADQERHRKIVQDSNEYLKEAVEKQTEAMIKLYEQQREMDKQAIENLKKIEKNTKGGARFN
jgi:hypothetical protein